MFLVVGGRGYHELRTRVGLRSWARCVRHVTVLTDPNPNPNPNPNPDPYPYPNPNQVLTDPSVRTEVGEYSSPHRYVYVASGDTWTKPQP